MKRYPRFSETFIVNEILAHENAGLEIGIFSLRPPIDTHFQDVISRVRAPVEYVSSDSVRAADLWLAMQQCAATCSSDWRALDDFIGEPVINLYQGIILARKLKEGGYTHMHAHFASVATSIARIASRLANIPYTFTAHAKDIFHESVVEEDIRTKIADAIAVVTVSRFNVENLTERFPESANKIRLIYNGIDLDRFVFHDTQQRDRTIVFVGRLVEKKGLPTLVRACDILNQRDIEFQCRIIGTGEEEQATKAAIEENHLAGRVEMVGPLPQAEVAEEIARAAAVAAPCVVGADGNRDGLPTVILEAMALGTPCVSTDVTGIPEVVKNGETGTIVPQYDAVALADAMLRLLDDAQMRTKYAEAGRRLIEHQFDATVNTREQRDLFNRAEVVI
ncbi:MAG: glycosyltransferase [Armatimonadota bacterium]|nr:glycosyltransferase [Armatimonadota bacterium]